MAMSRERRNGTACCPSRLPRTPPSPGRCCRGNGVRGGWFNSAPMSVLRSPIGAAESALRDPRPCIRRSRGRGSVSRSAFAIEKSSVAKPAAAISTSVPCASRWAAGRPHHDDRSRPPKGAQRLETPISSAIGQQPFSETHAPVRHPFHGSGRRPVRLRARQALHIRRPNPREGQALEVLQR